MSFSKGKSGILDPERGKLMFVNFY